jgi:hypothetical protein
MQRIGDFRLGKRTTRDGLNDDLYDFEPLPRELHPRRHQPGDAGEIPPIDMEGA